MIPKVREIDGVRKETPEHEVDHNNAKVDEDLTKYVDVKNVHWRIVNPSTDFVN